MIYFFAALILLGVLITIHEFGHFIIARFFNIYVQRFSIGMGPVIIKKEDSSGTEYAISALPLGGYVAMLSEKALQEDNALRDTLTKDQLNKTFESKPRWQRALVMLAGPLANFILSIFIFFFIFSNSLERTFNLNVGEITSTMIIESTQIQSGHVLKSINGKILSNLQELRLELLSMSGMTGDIFFEFENENGQSYSQSIFVKDFLSSEESQLVPENAFGFNIELSLIPYVGQILENSNAFNSELKLNDLIVKANSVKIKSFEQLKEIVTNSSEDFISLEVLRDNNTYYMEIPLSKNLNPNSDIPILGIVPGKKRSILQSFITGVDQTFDLSIRTLSFIGKMITGDLGTQNLSGPIGIVKAAGDSAKLGFLPFLYLMAILSISLGVINLLPIPVLDGGQLMMLLVEAIKGSPLPEKIENVIYSGGMAVVIMLMFFAIFNDITRFF